MKDWAMAHPYMTFFLLMLGIVTASGSFDRFLELFKRPVVKSAEEDSSASAREDLH